MTVRRSDGAGSSSLWDRASRLLDWSPVDKVLAIGVLVLGYVAYWTLMAEYIVRHPETVTFADQSGMRVITWCMRGVTAGYAALCLVAAYLRTRRPHDTVIVYAHAMLYVLLVCVSAQALGLYTNMLTGVALLGGFSVGLVLWEPRPILLALFTGLSLLLAMTAAEQLGIVRYAPALRTAPFDDGRIDLAWLLTVGTSGFAAIAMFLSVLYMVIRRWKDREASLKRAHAIIRRYVPTQLAEKIRLGDYDALERHERRKVTILFADIKDFATMADAVEPEDLSLVLNDYLSEMTLIAERHGGTVDKFIGDAIMVYFATPDSAFSPDHAIRAVRTAIEMQQRLVALRDRWELSGFEHPVHVRIGIDTGQATVGAFGSPGRMEFTVVGRHVNLAARLQARCEPDRILASRSTWILVREHFACRPVGELPLKGFQHPVEAYEIRPPDGAP